MHGDAASMPLVTASEPYLKALVRWNVDGPDLVSVEGGFPIGVGPRERRDVESALGSLYDSIALIDHDRPSGAPFA